MQIWRDWNKVEGDEADLEGVNMDPHSEIKQASAAEVVTKGSEVPSEDDERAGQPLPLTVGADSPAVQKVASALAEAQVWPTHGLLSVAPKALQISDKIGLILPTSLCSGQVAVILVRRLNEKLEADPSAFGIQEKDGRILRLSVQTFVSISSKSLTLVFLGPSTGISWLLQASVAL